MKTIGIIGAGHIGQAVARQLLKSNIPVLISNGREPETLRLIISKLGREATWQIHELNRF